jgi:hypothetical protein
MQNDWLSTLFNPNPLLSPAFGQMLASDPDSAVMALAQAGLPPPEQGGMQGPTGNALYAQAQGDGTMIGGGGRGAVDGGIGFGGGFDPSGMTRMLQGLQAPAAPVPQKVGTPGLPGAPAIPAAPIQALLQLMQGGAPKPQVPVRLGQALGR